jgi:hypothetical protein
MLNAMVGWQGLMMMVLFGAFVGGYQRQCGYWVYSYGLWGYFWKCNYYVTFFAGNYYVMQSVGLMWALGSLTPLWLGMKLSLPNHNLSKLCFMKSQTAYNATFWGFTIPFVSWFILTWVVMMAIGESNSNIWDLVDFYQSSVARVFFAKTLWFMVFSLNVIGTVFVSCGISNMNAFLKVYQGPSKFGIRSLLITYVVFQALTTSFTLLGLINLSGWGIWVVTCMLGFSMFQNIMLGALCNNTFFLDVYGKDTSYYFSEECVLDTLVQQQLMTGQQSMPNNMEAKLVQNNNMVYPTGVNSSMQLMPYQQVPQ